MRETSAQALRTAEEEQAEVVARATLSRHSALFTAGIMRGRMGLPLIARSAPCARSLHAHADTAT